MARFARQTERSGGQKSESLILVGEEGVEPSRTCVHPAAAGRDSRRFRTSGAAGRSRTVKGLRPQVFETCVYTNPTTAAPSIRGKYTSLPRSERKVLLRGSPDIGGAGATRPYY